MKLNKLDAKWYRELSGENYDVVYGLSDNDAAYEGEYITVAHVRTENLSDKSWCFMGFDGIWWFRSRESVAAFAKQNGFELPEEEKYTSFVPAVSPYERVRQQVYATGNRWAIENFNATH